MQMPLGAAQIVFLLLTSGAATTIPSAHVLMMIFNDLVSMAGMVMIWKSHPSSQAVQVTGLTLGAVFAANIPLVLSIISSNVAGFTKWSVTSTLLFIVYCMGNIVGPQFFVPSEEPSYTVSCVRESLVHTSV